MATIKPHRKLLRVVGLELARGAPVSTFEDKLARACRVSTRTVRRYAAAINQERDREDLESLKRARRQGRFVALAAASRWFARADALYAAAGHLIKRAERIDGKGQGSAARRLIAALEAAGRPLRDDEVEVDPDEIDALEREAKRTPVILEIARNDRRDAAILIKRAEAADARASDWYDKAQKIAGTYEPETYDPTQRGGAAANLTSAQKRAKLQRAVEAAKAIAAKARKTREASG